MDLDQVTQDAFIDELTKLALAENPDMDKEAFVSALYGMGKGLGAVGSALKGAVTNAGGIGKALKGAWAGLKQGGPGAMLKSWGQAAKGAYQPAAQAAKQTAESMGGGQGFSWLGRQRNMMAGLAAPGMETAAKVTGAGRSGGISF